MPIVVKIPGPYRKKTNGDAEAVVEGSTVREVLKNLITLYPELSIILDEKGELKRQINAFIGEDNIKELLGLDTIFGSNNVLSLIPAIAGG